MARRTYQDVNIPVFPGGDLKFAGLQYCAPARTLLATVLPASGSNPVRAFLRTTDEAVYRELIPSPPMQLLSACIASAAPFAFFIGWKGHAEGSVLYRAALPELVQEALPSAQVAGDHVRAWVSDLHAASADGLELLVSVSLQQKPAPDGGYEIRFVLGHMKVSDGSVTIIAELPAVFA
jgi:hypothetical protein